MFVTPFFLKFEFIIFFFYLFIEDSFILLRVQLSKSIRQWILAVQLAFNIKKIQILNTGGASSNALYQVLGKNCKQIHVFFISMIIKNLHKISL